MPGLVRSPLFHEILQGYLQTKPSILLNVASWDFFTTEQSLDGLEMPFSYSSSYRFSLFISGNSGKIEDSKTILNSRL